MSGFPLAKTAAAGLSMALLMSSPLWGRAATEQRLDARHGARIDREREAELASVAKTRKLLDDKLELRTGELKQRVRSLYKLNRASWPRVWMEPSARQDVSRWLGAGRRIIKRDLEEIDILHDEIALAERAQARLDGDGEGLMGVVPAAKSLLSPVADSKVVGTMGTYRDPHSRAQLRRRGVELRAVQGQKVGCVAAGRVAYAGPISGRAQGLIVDHGDYLSVTASLGQLEDTAVEVGTELRAGDVVGRASGEPVYLELRLRAGQRTLVLDPEPLLDL